MINEGNYLPLVGKIAADHLSQACARLPSEADKLKYLAEFFFSTGLPDEATETYEELVTKHFSFPVMHLYLLSFQLSSPEKYSHQYVHDAYVKWCEKLKYASPYTTYRNPLTSRRRLKIGYTCHFITNSTSTTLLLPLLKAHHRDRVEIFMYSDQPRKETTNEVRALAEHWRDTQGLSDDRFCAQVRKDKIDILLELNGHCAINRYRAFTRKPAPIQVSYYNHSDTCGVPGIDYVLVGEGLDIDKLQPYYTETIFHKKGVSLSIPLGDHFPPLTPSPFLKNGYITFGSFGQAHKISREQVHLWCEVLKAVPNSRFYMKASALGDPIKKSVFAKHFSDGGIDLSRVTLEGPSDYATLLRCYDNMDIALDSYPFGAGTTTIEATMQGVPTISLIGERYCSKHGWLTMHPIGHDELLSYSKAEFIEKATALAASPSRLIAYRDTLRRDFLRSPRGDTARFITELEDAYYDMWSKYLEQQSPKKPQGFRHFLKSFFADATA